MSHDTFWNTDHHKDLNQIWERKSIAGRFHELIFVSIETTQDMSHISPEYLCRFPAEKYYGIPGWARHNNLVQLKQQRRRYVTGRKLKGGGNYY